MLLFNYIPSLEWARAIETANTLGKGVQTGPSKGPLSVLVAEVLAKGLAGDAQEYSMR